MPLDLVIDPLTRDFVDTDDGGWLEADDSRTAVLLQLAESADAWWAEPRVGSRVPELLTRAEPATAEEFRDEVARALQVLVDEHVIAELSVAITHEETGRVQLELAYTDVGSGSRVDDLTIPLGGL